MHHPTTPFLTKFLLLQDQKDCVRQFPPLDEIIEIIQELMLLCPCFRGTNGIIKAMVYELRNQLFNQEKQQGGRDKCEQKVVQLEDKLGMVTWRISQHELATKDNHQVGDTANHHWKGGVEEWQQCPWVNVNAVKSCSWLNDWNGGSYLVEWSTKVSHLRQRQSRWRIYRQWRYKPCRNNHRDRHQMVCRPRIG